MNGWVIFWALMALGLFSLWYSPESSSNWQDAYKWSDRGLSVERSTIRPTSIHLENEEG
ncbi:hypothetical protein [Thioalkalivibrio sp. HK1]|uniref:hypothetical protein n=1 Tax=Thioalkalivibrio sp. HK1 TaxID=1469245 RepID=UPI0004B8343A|nr:hypothetical protein [Thioalkalivibrio sp. HK1]